MKYMKNRWNLRLPIRVPVCIQLPGREPTNAVSADLSLEGMFAETCALTVPTGTSLHVAIPCDDRATGPTVLVPATVVRHAPGGIGLSFAPQGTQTLEALKALMERHLDRMAAREAPDRAAC